MSIDNAHLDLPKKPPEDPFLTTTTTDRKFAHWRIVLEKPDEDEIEQADIDESDIEDEETEEYDSEEFISKPYLSENCTLSSDAISVHYSFGKDSMKAFNLVAVDDNTLLFGSGALIHIFDIPSRNLKFRRSAGGGGIGHIAKNPTLPHIAVGEKGINPLIIVYEWPSFKIISVLKEGTTKEYTHLSYRSDGTYLVSQGGDPDFLITVWNWKRSKIMLQVKSHTQDVFNVEFSRYFPGNLTSSGLGHIKFWKMAKTFTGLKLQGEIGKFGKTEICDIAAFYAMPDEKVLTSSEWGNILVWDEGMIKMQVSRKLEGMPCHKGPIAHFAYNHDDGYLLTAGLDGFLKIWFYRYINEQNPPDTDPFVRIEPSFSIEVKDDVGPARFVSLAKVDDDPLNHHYYGQGHTGIWDIHAEMKSEVKKSVRLHCFHKGPIYDLAVSPMSHHIATVADYGRFHIYDLQSKRMIFVKQFSTNIKAVMWLPSNVGKSGTVFVGGFIDGTIRIFVVEINELIRTGNVLGDYLHMIYSKKFHVGAINKLDRNEEGTILVSGGEDCTVFANQILPGTEEFVELEPIGFINTPAPITSITHKLSESTTFLVCCVDGHFLEVTFPNKRMSSSVVSYELDLETKLQKFVSIKSEILRDLEIQEIERKKQVKLEAKMVELDKVKKENPNLDINEEAFLADSELDIELPPLFVPKEASPIISGMYDEHGFAWLSLGGYDSGYLFKYDMNSEYLSEPSEYRLVSDETEMCSCCIKEIENGYYILAGLSNGVIRLISVSYDRDGDYSNYLDLPIHDNVYGRVTKLIMSHDNKYLYSCGEDSNIFAFKINLKGLYVEEKEKYEYSDTLPTVTIPDAGPGTYLSLEEDKRRLEHLKKMREAEAHKESVREKLKNCRERFLKILEKNNSLPEKYRFTPGELEIDSRVTKHLENKLQSQLDLVKTKLRFDLEKSKLLYEKVNNYFIKPLASFKVSVFAIGKDTHVDTFVHKKLDEEFYSNYEKLVKIIKPDLRNEVRPEKIKTKVIEEESDFVPVPVMPWLRGEDNFYEKLNSQALRALDRYLARQKFNENRESEWRTFMNSKPDINKLDPKDLARIDYAQRTIGDYKLKTSPDYKVPRNLRVSVAQKHRQLLMVRKSVHDEKQSFNKKVIKLRDEKVAMVKQFRKLYAILNQLHGEIDASLRKNPPAIPSINVDLEFPERKFQLHPQQIGIEEDVPLQIIDDELMYLYPELMPCNYSDDIKDETETNWTKERKIRRTVRRLVEQDSIISSMETIIKDHNKRVDKLNWEKMELSVKIKMLEIFQLTVYQELITIKCFEKLENEIMDNVEVMLGLKTIEMFKMNRNRNKILSALREINSLHDKENEVLTTFQEIVLESKFVDFLTKVYKKKYKQPKNKKEDDSDSSSSEESSSDDLEDESSDEGEMKIIKFDENICPEGCDVDVYKQTFVLRAQRHELELEVMEMKRKIEVLKKENEFSSKKLLQIDVILRLHQEKLESFQRQKQRKVNEVETIVVLKCDQLLNYKEPDELGSIDESVLMPKESLKKLNDRVAGLIDETKAEKLKHEQYKTHLQRMKVDVKAMEHQIDELKKKIKNEKMIKFGAEINIDRLEDSVLKEMILAVRFDVASLEKELNKKVESFKEMILTKAEEKARIQRENTNKLQLLSSLRDEKAKVQQILLSQTSKKTKIKDKVLFEQEINSDIKHLEKLLKDLNSQKEILLNEIRVLSLKGRALPPIQKAGPSFKDKIAKKKSSVPGKIDSAEDSDRRPDEICQKKMQAKFRFVTVATRSTSASDKKSCDFNIEVPHVDTGLRSARESESGTESPSFETPNLFGIEMEEDGDLYQMCMKMVEEIVEECTSKMVIEIVKDLLNSIVGGIGDIEDERDLEVDYSTEKMHTDTSVDEDAGHQEGDTDAGHEDGNTDTGDEDGNTDARHEDGNTDAGHEDEKTDTGHEDGNTDAGHEDERTDTGHEDGNTDAGHEDEKTDTGHEDGNTDAGHEDEKTDTGHEDGNTDAGHEDEKTDTGHEDGNTDEGHEDGISGRTNVAMETIKEESQVDNGAPYEKDNNNERELDIQRDEDKEKTGKESETEDGTKYEDEREKKDESGPGDGEGAENEQKDRALDE